MPRARKSKYFALALAAMALSLCALSARPAAAANLPREVTVVVLPFEINAGEDLSYLRQSLPDLLSDRLRDAGFNVVDKAAVEKALAAKGMKPTDPAAVREAGLLTNAGYVITGSFSQLGETLSIDARVNDPFGVKPPMPAFASKEGLINLIPAVDDLVTKMRGDLLGVDRIVDVDVEGAVALDKEVVLMRLSTKKGEPLDAKAINTDLKTIYDLGYFDDVKAILRDASGGKKLVIQVVEKPRILALGVKGAKAYSTEDLLKVANSKKGAVLNPKVLAEDMAAIREMYRKEGYYNAKVTHEIETAGQGQARLNFVIDEGKKLYIKKIVIQGAKQISEGDLKDELALKERGFFSWFTQGGVLKEDLLERDAAALAAYYNNRGFMDAKVGSPEVNIGEDGIDVTFKVEEGARFRVESVHVEGDLIADEPKLIELTKMGKAATEKNYLDRSAIRDDLKMLTDYYNTFGYAYAEANVRVNDHPEEKTVDVIYVMRKLQKVHIRRVLVEGNTKTRDNVIMREMRLADGDLFNGEKLKRSNERLNKLGYFSMVDIEPVPTGSPDEMDLKVKVKDKETGKIGGGVGYSTYDGVYFAASIDESNLFGKGWSASLNGQWSDTKTSYTFTAMNPRWDDTKLGVGFSLYDRKDDYTDYMRASTGGKIGFSYPLGEYTSLLWDYNIERYTIYDIVSGAAQEIVDAAGTSIASIATASIVRDTTDGSQQSLATKGTVNTFSVAYGGGVLMGDDNFIRSIYDHNGYQKLLGDLVFHWHGQVGWVGQNGNGDIPLGQRFYLGGSSTVRGYTQRKIAPIDEASGDVIGGDKEAFANLELIHPLSKKAGVYGSVFFDAGGTWKEGEMLFSNPTRRVAAPPAGLYKSVGVGLLWFSPMGPLKLEFGHGMDDLYDSTHNKVEFNMGRTF
jgi:outer membrane protein insertion porin family